MKVLLNCHVPFSLAHGGAQIQIEQTKAALEKIGVEVEPLRWWEEKQTGQVLHHFGRIPTGLLRMAQRKGMKVVLAELLTEQGSRSMTRLRLEKFAFRTIETATLGSMAERVGWESYRAADACVALTPWEKFLMTFLFAAPPERVHVVPNGVEDVFFQSEKSARGQWLVCTATIAERKRVLELAQAAVAAKTPLWVIGKPYADSEPYAQRFLEFARQHASTIRYEGAISDRAQLARVYREARGFVLLSTMESLSLSALESAACECPLLLSDLPWARMTFHEDASYCPIAAPSLTAAHLRQFYDAAPTRRPPPKPPTWIEIAGQLKGVYERALNSTSARSTLPDKFPRASGR
jgi:glycosyltransferase involved in cell wall biosynthesis